MIDFIEDLDEEECENKPFLEELGMFPSILQSIKYFQYCHCCNTGHVAANLCMTGYH